MGCGARVWSCWLYGEMLILLGCLLYSWLDQLDNDELRFWWPLNLLSIGERNGVLIVRERVSYVKWSNVKLIRHKKLMIEMFLYMYKYCFWKTLPGVEGGGYGKGQEDKRGEWKSWIILRTCINIQHIVLRDYNAVFLCHCWFSIIP